MRLLHPFSSRAVGSPSFASRTLRHSISRVNPFTSADSAHSDTSRKQQRTSTRRAKSSIGTVLFVTSIAPASAFGRYRDNDLLSCATTSKLHSEYKRETKMRRRNDRYYGPRTFHDSSDIARPFSSLSKTIALSQSQTRPHSPRPDVRLTSTLNWTFASHAYWNSSAE